MSAIVSSVSAPSTIPFPPSTPKAIVMRFALAGRTPGLGLGFPCGLGRPIICYREEAMGKVAHDDWYPSLIGCCPGLSGNVQLIEECHVALLGVSNQLVKCNDLYPDSEPRIDRKSVV